MANSAINPARSRPARHVSNVSWTILGEGNSFTHKKYTFNFIKKIWNRTSTIEMQMGPANLRISAKSSLNIFVQYCQRLSNIKHYLYVCDQHQQYQQAGLGVWLFSYLLCLLAWVAACCYSQPSQFPTQLLLVPGISTCSTPQHTTYSELGDLDKSY